MEISEERIQEIIREIREENELFEKQDQIAEEDMRKEAIRRFYIEKKERAAYEKWMRENPEEAERQRKQLEEIDCIFCV